MKNLLTFSVLMLALVFCFNQEAYGQSGKKKSGDTEKYFDESGSFTHRLWYGSHFTLGFSGSSFQSLFQFGLSPMIGYKIFESFSVGPRFSVLYYNYREDFGGGRVEKINTASWSIGAFARFKPFPAIFAQVEYSWENEPFFTRTGNGLETVRAARGNYYLGGGYNGSSGGPWGFEALILYNVNQAANSFESPLDYRVGVTYNF